MKQAKSLFVTKLPSLTALILIILATLLFSGCKSLRGLSPQKTKNISRMLSDQGILSAKELTDFFLANNPEENYKDILYFARLYIKEAAMENINSDIAFAQMCLETGFLRFGGLVQAEWHNYCGLGAISPENPGCIFESKETGVRAHIQHLQAYATTEEIALHNELVDPRYNWVHKSKYALTMEEMAASWAADPSYAQKLESLLQRMEGGKY